MKKTLVLAAVMAASALSANAAYLLSGVRGTQSQPDAGSPGVYGVRFTLASPLILDGFAIYDYNGDNDGWTAGNAKTVSLYSVNTGTGAYTQMDTKTFTSAPGASLGTVVTNADMHFGSFNSVTHLAAGTYFLALSEIKTLPLYDGYFVLNSPVTNPTLLGMGVSGVGYRQLDGETAPGSFNETDTVGTSRLIGVIPSLVAVPEAGSSVMALALGAMVLRFRSRRA